ncbi:MAG: hypothetical protein EBU84_20555, partial [Actinobacteria bacterium]|nr:hypothetical protein [Actinomycetota bacterium]
EEQRAQAYNDAFASGVKTSAGIIYDPKEILKSKQFGGFAGRGREADVNETQFADSIKKFAAKGPIDVVLGNYKIPGVVDARRTGAERVEGQTSKADVVLVTKGGKEVKISIKMKTADYYLSGDAMLAPVVGPIVQGLLKVKAPSPRIQKSGDLFVMVQGPKSNPAQINMSFEISDELANMAVFGSGNNSVDVIVKGDLTGVPVVKGKTYTWPVTVFRSVEELPETDQPVGLLRAGEAGRGFTFGGIRRQDELMHGVGF